MEVICLKCKRHIADEHINVAKDTAYCTACGELTSLSSLMSSSTDPKFDLYELVKGTNYKQEGFSWKLEASHRSWSALFLIPFTAVWAGISLSGIYGSQIESGEFDLQASLFGVPFLIGSIVLISITLMSIMGKTVISNENGKGLIFMGIGSIGWYRRFDWNSISSVVEKQSYQYEHISLEGKKRINFGWGLGDKKRYYLANALRSKLKI